MLFQNLYTFHLSWFISISCSCNRLTVGSEIWAFSVKYGTTTTACASRLQMLPCSVPEQFYTCVVTGSHTFLVIVNMLVPEPNEQLCPLLYHFFDRTYFDQRWIAAMYSQHVEVEASVVIPTDICLLLIREFMHYAACSNFKYNVHYIL